MWSAGERAATDTRARAGRDRGVAERHLTTHNPYLRELSQTHTPGSGGDYRAWLHGRSEFERRKAGVRRYAFGVPNDAALDAIACHGPIVELGAGTGYWAYLLRQRGVDIVAYDAAPPGLTPNVHYFEPRTWADVVLGGIEVLAAHADRALFLCWPGYRDPFAYQALTAYSGTTLLYVGEPRGGHTADDAFFDRLASDWQLVQRVSIPRWRGTRDDLTIYQRAISD